MPEKTRDSAHWLAIEKAIRTELDRSIPLINGLQRGEYEAISAIAADAVCTLVVPLTAFVPSQDCDDQMPGLGLNGIPLFCARPLGHRGWHTGDPFGLSSPKWRSQ